MHTSRPLIALGVIAACVLLFPLLVAAAPASQSPDGRKLFMENCAACHGDNASGDRKPSDLGFNFKMPNFTDCSFATREADGDWASTIHRGGRARAFPRQMPAWDEALSDDEIDAIIAYLRTKCEKSGYPRGEFNLPLAMFTEKAFPEDELFTQTEINTEGPAGFTTTTTFEKRFGKTGQLEVNLPVGSIFDGSRMQSGIGDMGVAWKQNILADVDQGSILSLLGEVVLPTGNARKGLGDGVYSFETHALFAQLLPDDFFLQGDVFGAFPTGAGLPDEGHVNLALGRTFAEDGGWGRAWSPQVEFLTTHSFATGGQTDYDIVPQLQVSLSARQHILFSMGERIPLNDRATRKPQFVFYLIWDWYDAGLFEGWK